MELLGAEADRICKHAYSLRADTGKTGNSHSVDILGITKVWDKVAMLIAAKDYPSALERDYHVIDEKDSPDAPVTEGEPKSLDTQFKEFDRLSPKAKSFVRGLANTLSRVPGLSN